MSYTIEDLSERLSRFYVNELLSVADALRDRLAALDAPPPAPQSAFVQDVDRWRAELIAAGWVELRSTMWASPTGGTWRGPAGAWNEMKRQQAAAAPQAPEVRQTLEPSEAQRWIRLLERAKTDNRSLLVAEVDGLIELLKGASR